MSKKWSAHDLVFLVPESILQELSKRDEHSIIVRSTIKFFLLDSYFFQTDDQGSGIINFQLF